MAKTSCLMKRTGAGGHLQVPRLTIMGESRRWLTLDTGYTSEGLLASRHRLIGLHWASLPTEGSAMRRVS